MSVLCFISSGYPVCTIWHIGIALSLGITAGNPMDFHRAKLQLHTTHPSMTLRL